MVGGRESKGWSYGEKEGRREGERESERLRMKGREKEMKGLRAGVGAEVDGGRVGAGVWICC